MIRTRGYAAMSAKAQLTPFEFDRRDPGEHEVLIDVSYCGICHSDLHQAHDDWGGAIFPMVPGHEVVGRVARVGSAVTKFAVGDLAGVGCMVDSCRACAPCKEHDEPLCEAGPVWTYNGTERRGEPGAPTRGGYSEHIVLDEAYALRVSPKLDPAAAAPLLCAGITTWSPLRRWKVGAGQRVGVVGLGGLGHMAVRFARAMGAEVVLFTTSDKKRSDAVALGAHEVVVSTDSKAMEAQKRRMDFVLDTVSAPHDVNALLQTLRRDGVMTLVGLPPKDLSVSAFGLVLQRRVLTGSLIGGIKETQEMLDFCAEHGVVSRVEVVPFAKVNEAFARLQKGDVKYRFVLDAASLR